MAAAARGVARLGVWGRAVRLAAAKVVVRDAEVTVAAALGVAALEEAWEARQAAVVPLVALAEEVEAREVMAVMAVAKAAVVTVVLAAALVVT